MGKATDFGISAENIFGFWDWVGGRFSVCSAVGVLPLALQYGYPVVQQFLAGAHDMDAHFFEAPLRGNIPVLLGLLGVWNSSFLGHPARVILPCKFCPYFSFHCIATMCVKPNRLSRSK